MTPQRLGLLLPLAAAPPAVVMTTPMPAARPIAAIVVAARSEPPPPAPPPEPVPGMPPVGGAAAPAVPPRLIVPNSDGVIDLAAAAQAEAAGTLPNPFRTRSAPQAPVRQVSVTLGAVSVGGNPKDACVLFEGRPCSPGDSLAGLPILSITAEAVELDAGRLRARLPVRDQPVLLRLP